MSESRKSVDIVIVCRLCGTRTPSLARGLSEGCEKCGAHSFKELSIKEYELLHKITTLDYQTRPAIKISPTGKMLINLNHLLMSDAEQLVIQDSEGKYYISSDF